MKFYKTTTGYLGVNSYYLVNGNRCVVIDAGEDYDFVKRFAEEHSFSIEALLLTHAHHDHAGCAKKMQESGIKVYVSKGDADKLSDPMNMRGNPTLVPDFTFSGGEILNIAGIEIEVLETAGHTSGSVCFIVDDDMFSGDTLFCDGYGRTDLPTGNMEKMVKSLKMLFSQGKNYNVYPGHGEETTIDKEREKYIL